MCQYIGIYIYSFIHQLLYSPLLGPGLFFNFVIFSTQTVELLGREISPSQSCYLHAEQHRHVINANTDIHALSRNRIHDPSVQASEDSSCLRPRDHRDRRNIYTVYHISLNIYYNESISRENPFLIRSINIFSVIFILLNFKQLLRKMKKIKVNIAA
jgi:hypothetical protein